ncbi:serine/threonine protein kinase [Streptomyces sp. NPDC090798]|uniref:serine/threonine protein kinase n=1 Tax=Streptomyces sp. NPDC090798 TaxID=3365968 RepID=UPI003821F51B
MSGRRSTDQRWNRAPFLFPADARPTVGTPKPSEASSISKEHAVSLPSRIGPYTPLRPIGEGGMGTIHFAYHPGTGEPTAVKTIRPEFASDAPHRARFAREVDLLRKVSGPYLVRLIDADPDADLPWLAMPYVPGNTLQRQVQVDGPLQGSNLLTFAAAVAHALACIHAAGVAHRDLKPQNVILAADGPRVVDFGIAHHPDSTAITRLRQPGTEGWMAPEQLLHGSSGPECDIFTWGILVAYAAAGTHPYGPSIGRDSRILHGRPDLSSVPELLREPVIAALHHTAELRPSAGQIAEQVARLLGVKGTVAFPTVALTRPDGDPDEWPTVNLQDSEWDVPAAEADLAEIVPFVACGDWRSGQSAHEALAESEAALESLHAAITESQAHANERRHAHTALHVTRTELGDIRAEFTRGGWLDRADLTRAVDAATEKVDDLVRGSAQPSAPGAGWGQRKPEPGVGGGVPSGASPGPVPPVGRSLDRPQAAAGTGQPESRTTTGRRRPHKGRILMVALLGGAVTTCAVALAANGHDKPTAKPATSSPAATRAADPPTAVGSSPTSPSASPSPSPTATPTPTPTITTLFGGLRVTTPASWDATAVPQDSLNSDDGMDSKYAMNLSPVDAADNAGLAIEWAPGMTSVKGGANDTENSDFGMFTKRFSTGGADPAAGGTAVIGTDVREQTVTSVDPVKLMRIGGTQAQSYTVHTDVLPDYNRTRAAVHRVWFLPRPHYVLYTYGKLTEAQNAQVDDVIASLRSTPVSMPLDCADAVLYLDAAARGSTPDGDDPSQSCLDLTVNATEGSDQSAALDPGTVQTSTEPECLAIVSEYDPTYLLNGGALDYTAARRQCDVPRHASP